MKYSKLISLCIVFACSSPYKALKPVEGDPDCLRKFQPKFKTDWYEATVDVVGNHISGLILFKTMPDSSVRVAFTGKTGIKFLDFEFGKEGKFRSHYVMEKLNKKVVINLLRKDFELMMMRSVDRWPLLSYTDSLNYWYATPDGKKGADYYVTSPDCTQLIRVENGGRKKALEVRFANFDGRIPGAVHLKHFTFDMEINLTKIEL